MFEIAVLGPIVTRGVGVVGQCIACRAALRADAPSCSGFGAGCLVQSAAAGYAASRDPNSDAKRSTSVQSV